MDEKVAPNKTMLWRNTALEKVQPTLISNQGRLSIFRQVHTRKKLWSPTWQTVCHQGYTWHQKQGHPSTVWRATRVERAYTHIVCKLMQLSVQCWIFMSKSIVSNGQFRKRSCDSFYHAVNFHVDLTVFLHIISTYLVIYTSVHISPCFFPTQYHVNWNEYEFLAALQKHLHTAHQHATQQMTNS